MAVNTHRVVASCAQDLAVIRILSAVFAQLAPSAVLFSPILRVSHNENIRGI